MPVIVKLKELRKKKNISQNELARRLEMSLPNVQKIEYNKAKSIPFDTLEAICTILECEVGELLVLVKNE
jgi:putative transcriptional regulator